MNQHKTIYIVDDDEDDRMLMREALTNALSPINIVDVENGEKLTEYIDNTGKGPKLILMDMNMPRVNGMEMLAMLKGDVCYRHIPVVMVSTTTNQAMINQAYNLGANAFIVKPATYEEYQQIALGVGLCFLNNDCPIANSPVPPVLGEKTIVVVEDSDDHWFLLENALKSSSMNYNVVRINSKMRALAFANEELPNFLPAVDVILVDLYLPQREDGLDLLLDIRQALRVNSLENIPIVVFTYSDSIDDIDESYRHQANAYLIKPLNITRWRFYFENLLGFWSKSIQPAAKRGKK